MATTVRGAGGLPARPSRRPRLRICHGARVFLRCRGGHGLYGEPSPPWDQGPAARARRPLPIPRPPAGTGHGTQFQAHMKRINTSGITDAIRPGGGYEITVRRFRAGRGPSAPGRGARRSGGGGGMRGADRPCPGTSTPLPPSPMAWPRRSGTTGSRKWRTIDSTTGAARGAATRSGAPPTADRRRPTALPARGRGAGTRGVGGTCTSGTAAAST